MQSAAAPAVAPEGAWNPGLESELPRQYVPMATVFRREHIFTSLTQAQELSDYCGLPAHELVAFRPERLVIHELLIRVTADLAVPDGEDYEDLGRNFRDIAGTILASYLAPRQRELAEVYARIRAAAAAVIARELAALFDEPPAPAAPASAGWWQRWFGVRGGTDEPALPAETLPMRKRRILTEWAAKADTASDRLERSCCRALSRVATAVTARHGRLLGARELISELALALTCNEHGSMAIGEAITPLFQDAVARERFDPLALQAHPVVMNVKGASASGKSSMRPLQRLLAKKLGLPWEEFALISPDVWRKFLLDYRSLGPAAKYAGMLTGHELEIVDRKLDRYMADKAARGETSHLLIDRFRFDSFVPERGESVRLLTRFGDQVYMFFMITPPEMTVERAWTRGLKVGRYKAVEDLLAHNVEAYTGMPELFFTWALDPRRRVHYEFLDNSVAEGRPPRTVAFGWNGEMTILDIRRMLDIDRFRKINIRARDPAEVYSGLDLAAERNTDFLRRCVRLIPVVNFADQDSGDIYARIEHGRWVWRDEARFARTSADPDLRVGLQVIAQNGHAPAAVPIGAWADLELDRLHTLGAWGTDEQVA